MVSRRNLAVLAVLTTAGLVAFAPARPLLAQGAAAPAPATQAPAVAPAPMPLASHRATYELTLEPRRGKGNVEAARGRIVYDFSGNACEGYALQFRQITELAMEGRQIVSDLRSTTWEDGKGTSYRFNSQSFMNQQPTDSSDGLAEEGQGGAVTVKLRKPEEGTVQLSGPLVFPTEHIKRILAAAKRGETLLETDTFDGSETGKKVYHTLSVIGRPIAPGSRAPDDAAAKVKELSGMTRWTTTISYFEDQRKADDAGEQTPVYSITFEIYENGISRALVLDYGDFVLRGEMTALELLPSKPCP
jgi:hypothetical protein